MKFRCEIEMDNAAFDEGAITGSPEVARILHDVADKAEAGFRAGACRDLNGNTVGRWAIDEEDVVSRTFTVDDDDVQVDNRDPDTTDLIMPGVTLTVTRTDLSDLIENMDQL